MMIAYRLYLHSISQLS